VSSKRLIRLWCFCAIAALFVAACSSEPVDDTAYEQGETPDDVFFDFVTSETDSGRTTWRLTAPEASRFKEKKLVILDNPTIQFYNEEGAIRTTLVSDSGQYFEDTKNLLAFGNVVVTSIDGDVLETDSLYWDNAQNKILSDAFVKLTRGRDVITGYGLECRDDLGTVDIKRDVKATVVDEEGEFKE
jgi:LPS export ABC transporter protein LptC